MRILKSPQRADEKINYSIENEVITVEFREQTEVYDFSTLPNGIAEEIKSEVFSFNPVLSAKREDGVLSVELLNFIGADATEAERFPEWEEV